MGIYRFFPTKDTWVTNRLRSDFVRATGSNHGLSPSLNVFSYLPAGQSGSNLDIARTLIQFNVSDLSSSIYVDEKVPSSSVTYSLKMFDMKHADTVPTSFDLFIFPISRSWDEGTGVDDGNDRDSGYANWINAQYAVEWTSTGSDFLATEYGSASQHFDRGSEDLVVDVTDVVQNWLTSSISNNGFVIKMGEAEEVSGTDYRRKAFHGRESKYVDKIPYIEATWEEVTKDNRGNFAFDQSNYLYMYNVIRGELTNVTEPVIVRIQEALVSSSYTQEFTASRVSTGIYRVSVDDVSPTGSGWWRDIWYSGSQVYMSSSFRPLTLTGSSFDLYDSFVVDIVNAKRIYSVNESPRLKVHVRSRDWVTHYGIINSSSLDVDQEYMEKMYFSVENEESGEVVIPFGTGSVAYTQLSYNKEGNYFDIDMASFIPGFKYRFKFLIEYNKDRRVIDSDFTFKVV